VNINENCGSTHPEHMAARVRETNADAGLAFDGRRRPRDPGRPSGAASWTATGPLCLAGIHFARQNQLPGGTVVGTDYSNLGLEQALERNGLRLVRAKTGDRYVAEKMAESARPWAAKSPATFCFPSTRPPATVC
jgi:phosphoglucosamine mutase